MFTLTELFKKPVVAVDTAEELGRVSGVLVDPATRLITRLVVGGRKGRVAAREAVRGVSGDVVTLADVSSLHEPADEVERDLLGGRFDLLKKRVLTTAGFDAGQVQDCEFDDNGMLVRLLTSTQTIPGEALRGVGSYAVVVEHPPEGVRSA